MTAASSSLSLEAEVRPGRAGKPADSIKQSHLFTEPYLVVILGAGRPRRGKAPSALTAMPDRRRVLDWLLEAFALIPADVHYVGGYQLDDVARHAERLNFAINADWQTTGNVASLFAAPLTRHQECLVCYSDIVFSKHVVQKVCQTAGDAVLAVDRAWRDRFAGRTSADMEGAEKVKLAGSALMEISSDMATLEADAEYIGLAKFSSQAVSEILALRDSSGEIFRTDNLPSLFGQLLRRGLDCRVVDIGGEWAELNAPQDLARFVLGTKAETLEQLRPMVRNSVVKDQVRFTVDDWRSKQRQCVRQIAAKFGTTKIVVRSSTLTEDSWSTARAGAFLSLLDVPGNDHRRIADAVERVIASYSNERPDNQVLVQDMVQDARISGVAFTRSLSYGAPYYTINYDESTCSTETVTNGSGRDLRTLVMHRSVAQMPPNSPAGLRPLLAALREIEALVGHDSLDIEFAIAGNGTVYLLQVRPIAVDHGDWHGSDEAVEASLATAERAFDIKQTPGPFTLGGRAIFGVMPDWNPAEIVGVRPGRLALSLYRYLFTDEVWATQRAEYGYRDVRPQPLMVTLAGHPYIDVRASFNSFIPASIPEDLANRLVDNYLNTLEERPQLHDKIEFDIALTCLTFDFDRQTQRLRDAAFDSEEISLLRDALRDITRAGFDRCAKDMAQIGLLEARFCKFRPDSAPLDRAFVLLEDCRRYGALPFAHLARSGFVAVSLLRSAVAEGIMSEGDAAAYLNSLNTVAKQLTRDAAAVVTGEMSRDSYFASYGHLRPGTYDITTPSYSKDPELYLLPIIDKAQEFSVSKNDFVWTETLCAALTAALGELGLSTDIHRVDRFFRQAIEGRERAKFAFTRNLSAALDAITEFGTKLGLTREDLSHISLEELRIARSGEEPPDVSDWLHCRAEEGREWHGLAQGIELPPLLVHADEIRAFHYAETQPNFVTGGKVVADIVCVSASTKHADELSGKVVLIPQADPGYDWLFGYNVGGLITKYGGANSHMAIRAAEFCLPAAIGVGEVRYSALAQASIVSLDCMNRRIEVVQ